MDPLSQLHDISMGDAIGLWPLAWGWWVLSAALLVSLVLIAFAFYRRYQFNKPRAVAIKALQDLQHLANERDLPDHYSAVNQILKRCARHYYGQQTVSRLFGDPWLTWLSEKLPKRYQADFMTDMRDLCPILYQTNRLELAHQDNKIESYEKVYAAALVWLRKAHIKRGDLQYV